MPRRFQFSLKTFLVAVLIVAAFFAGMAAQRQLEKPLSKKLALPFLGVIRGEFGLDAAGEVVQFGDGAMRDAAEAVHLEY
jgi:hypothetical protein